MDRAQEHRLRWHHNLLKAIVRAVKYGVLLFCNMAVSSIFSLVLFEWFSLKGVGQGLFVTLHLWNS